MKIHFVTSEVLPFSKTGGLADVCYGLGKAFAHLKHEISIFTPLYRGIYNKSFKHLATIPVDMSWRHRKADIYTTVENGITYYFISDLYYFNRETLYGYDDDIERFAFFQLAYIQLIKRLNLKADIIHVHDWESAMVPLLLKLDGNKTKTVLTIHNPAFQGNSHPSDLYNLFNIDSSYYDDGTCKFHDFFSCLKTGIMTASKVTTVSNHHAEELLEDKVSYNQLGYIIELRKNDFSGIVNGVDEDDYNPSVDKFIEKNYSIKDYEEGKKACKKALEDLFHLEPVKGPSLGIISRLTEQKGLDSLPILLPLLIKYDMRLYVLGSGEFRLQTMISQYSKAYPRNVVYYEGYSTPLAHKIYAATDFFLLPSRYEPCGIGQLIAKAYGSIPVVSSAGGLYDTVIPYDGKNSDVAEGFRFPHEDPTKLMKIIEDINVLYNKKSLEPLITNSMKANSSWLAIAPKYLDLYKSIKTRTRKK